MYDSSRIRKVKLFDYQDLNAFLNKRGVRTYSIFVRHNNTLGYSGFHIVIRELDKLKVIHEDASKLDSNGKRYYYRNNKLRPLKQDLLSNSIERLLGLTGSGFDRIIDYILLLKKQLAAVERYGFSPPW